MSNPKRKALVTGCSDGGLGAALAVAFHNADLHVYATARNPSRMAHLVSLGIETLTLDVLSDTSIADCASKLTQLDILVNNAGANYVMPFSDLSIPAAKKLFDLNVWSYLVVTHAFLPFLLKSKGMIVNNTSIASSFTQPFSSAYNASKAAIAMISDTQRLELEPFGVTVVELKTGVVNSHLIKNQRENHGDCLPQGSIYSPAKDIIDKALRGDEFVGKGMPAEKWAALVVQDLLKQNPPPNIWRGDQAWLVRHGSVLPFGTLDGTVKKLTGLDGLAKRLKEREE